MAMPIAVQESSVVSSIGGDSDDVGDGGGGNGDGGGGGGAGVGGGDDGGSGGGGGGVGGGWADGYRQVIGQMAWSPLLRHAATPMLEDGSDGVRDGRTVATASSEQGGRVHGIELLQTKGRQCMVRKNVEEYRSGHVTALGCMMVGGCHFVFQADGQEISFAPVASLGCMVSPARGKWVRGPKV